MENNNLTTTNNAMAGFGAFKKANKEVVGLDLSSSDLKLPKIKVMQATSQEVAKSKGKILAGQFYNTVTQTAKDKVDCILLDQGKSMVMWKKPFKRGEEPLCRSFDGKIKTEGCGDGNCATCKFSSQNPKAWEAAKLKGETKPECNMSYVFLAIDTETKMPFRIIFAGASVSNAKDFLNQIAPMRLSPFCFKVTLSTSQQENESGVFYVTNFENIRPNDDILNSDGELDDAKYEEYENQSKSYKELFMTQIVANDIIDVDTTTSGDGSENLF